jgi:hypothetical protein
MALKMNQTAPKSKWLSTILYSCLDTYSHRQIDMTKLTVVSPPKHIQYVLDLRGTEVSNHLHTSTYLTLWAKHPQCPKAGHTASLNYTTKFGNDRGRNMKYHNDNVNLTVPPAIVTRNLSGFPQSLQATARTLL